jgi:RimJ/RimL family protein N-acetyltransferase
MSNNQIQFREIKISDAKKILKWRRKKRVTNFQFTDIHNSLKLQKKWILDSYNKKNYYHWLIMYKKKIIGFFSINKINLKKGETTWSWYIGSDNHLPLGGFIPPFFYNWVFNKFKINKINAFVFENNVNVIKIHKFHGYKTLKKKYTIIKNDKKIKYIKMFLSKKNWNFNKYSKYVTDFPIDKWKVINNK